MAEIDRTAIRAAADDLHGVCSDRGYSDAVAVLRDAAPALLTELERTEGDLAVAVAEAQDARGRLDKAQRVLTVARMSKYRDDAFWLWVNFRAALAAPVQPEETQHG